MRALILSTARVAALAVAMAVVAGCTTSDPEPKASRSVKPPEVALTEACPGLITDAAGEAVRAVLQSSQLVNDDAQTVGVTAMGKALEGAYKAGPKVRETPVAPCVVTGSVGRGSRVAEIRLSADSGKAGPLSPDRVGVRVVLGAQEGSVSFDCASTRAGSSAEVPLRVTSVFTNRFHKIRKDDRPEDHYLVVAHSAALAVARELGCANEGGLPARAGELPPAQPGSSS
ncbi:hypothetical protein OG625_24430 [Streptomyces sp. NBC_01351]|uniref:hypothetical protein n=1 Tax=Streptomyces sp. NBC_01351 TaxID=2903833 RepID=UPI002E338214|nr:hypothetical protein [Streptomyces sp. NBC_01351]